MNRSLVLLLGLYCCLFASAAPAVSQQSTDNTSSASATSPLPGTTNSVVPASSVSSIDNAKSSNLILDFGSNSVLNLSGALLNSGTIYAISTNPHVNTAVINAANVINNQGAVITTILPSSGLAGVPFAVSNLSLTFNIVNNFVNSGSVTSAANLNINAGGQILNGLPAGTTGITPLMQAANSITLFSAAGLIANAGNINAVSGNINIASLINQGIMVNNIGGILQASMGQINFRDSSYGGTSNLALIGGDILTKDLNLFSGSGIATVDIHSLLGTLNINAGEAHVQSEASTLQLGRFVITGDPTIYNAGGDVIIDSDLVFSGADLAIVANGDILAASNSGKIETSGGNILLVAGAQFSSSSGSVLGSSTTSNAPLTLTIIGKSATGGRIDLVGTHPITSLSSANNSINGSGGSIELIALPGSNPLSGQITIPDTVTILTGGTGTGKNGDVIMGANSVMMGKNGKNPDSFISIDTRGGSGSGGNIIIGGDLQAANAPLLSSTGPCNTCAYIQTDKFINNSAINLTILRPSLNAGRLYAPGRDVSLMINGILTGSIIDDGNNTPGGNITIQQGGGNRLFIGPNFLTLFAGSSTGVSGILSAKGSSGGSIKVSAVYNLSSIQLLSAANIDVSASNGNGGTILLAASAFPVLLPGGSISADAAGGNFNGGNIYINTDGTALGFSKIPLYLPSYLSLSAPLLLSANGSGKGNGGVVNIVNSTDLSAGQLSVSATGGSLGSSAGNGGTVIINNSTNALTVDPLSIRVSPLGVNGNGGTIYLSGSPLVINGSLLATGGGANGQGTGNGGSISLMSATSNFSLGLGGAPANGITGKLDVSAGVAGGAGGKLSVNTKGTLSVLRGTLSADAAGPGDYDGGSVSVITDKFSVQLGPGATSLEILTANASGNGNGGIVLLQAAQSDITVNAGKTLRFFAKGGSAGSNFGDGGSITLEGNNLSIDPTFLIGGPGGTNGKGENISLIAHGSLFVNNAISADGNGIGDGGSVTLKTSSNLTLGNTPLAPNANAVKGDVTANAGLLGGSGGTVDIEGLGGGAAAMASLTLQADSNVQVNNVNGKGGTIILGNSQLAPQYPTATPTVQKLNIPQGSLNVDGSIAGGTIVLAANTLNITGGGALSLSAKSPGNGGSVSVLTTQGTVTTGTSSNNINIDVGGGNGGTIQIAGFAVNATPGDLKFSPNGSNGNGGNILLSGIAALQVNGDLSADGTGSGNGGSITLFCPGCNLSAGPGNPSSINGNLNANAGTTGKAAGTININAGNTTITSLTALQVSAPAGDGGTINLGAANVLTLPSGTLSVNGGAGNTSGGRIILIESHPSAGVIKVSGSGALKLQADGNGSGNGGTIAVTQTGAYFQPPFYYATNIGNSPKEISLEAIGGSNGGAGGNVSITANSTENIDSAAVNISPGLNGNGGSITINAPTFRVSGDVSANGSGNGNGGLVNLTFYNSPVTGPFIVGSPLAGLSSSGITGTVSASSPGGGAAGTVNLSMFFSTGAPLVVNSSIDAGSATGVPGSVNLINITSISGNGSINGTINTPWFTTINSINLPSSSGPLTLGSIRVGTITTNSVNIPLGSTVNLDTITAANVMNNGFINNPTPGATVTIQNPSFLAVSGNGVIAASNIVFSSPFGIVHQGMLIGNVTTIGSISLTVGNPALSTSAALGLTNTNVLRQSNNLVDTSLSNFSTNQFSSVVATDVTPRSVKLSSESETGETLELGEKVVVVNSALAFTAFVVSDDSLEFAEEDTEIAMVGEETYLRKGKLVLSTNKKTKVIRTVQGIVTIGADSVAAVTVSARGTLTVDTISGTGEFVSKSQTERVALASGNALLTNQDELSEEELIDANGSAGPVTGSVTKVSRNTLKRTIAVSRMIEKDIMINGSLIKVRAATTGQTSQYLRNLKHAKYDSNEAKPIGYVESVKMSLALAGDAAPLQKKMIFGVDGCKYTEPAANRLQLDSGELFFQAEENTELTAGECTVFVRKGACLNVSNTSSGQTTMRVCSGFNAVRVKVKKYSATLQAGEELVISNRRISTSEAFESDFVSHRDSRAAQCDGMTFIHSEFSIPSLLTTKSHMSRLLHSNASADKTTQAKVLKSAVVVQMVRGKKGPYSRRIPST